MKRGLFIILIQGSSIMTLLSQVPDYNLRKINLTAGDSVVKTQTSSNFQKKKILSGSPYYWYGAGRINVNQGSYSGKVLHGKYEVFDKNNRLVRQGNFDYGLKQGTWTTWFINGIKKEETSYNDGLLTGERVVYSPEGKLISKERFHKGLLHGKSIFYSNDTIITKEYKDGREVVKTRKPEKVTDKVRSQKRHPVFSRFYKPKESNDTIPLVKSQERIHHVFKKKEQNKEELKNSEKPNQ